VHSINVEWGCASFTSSKQVTWVLGLYPPTP
jgi:hypothetical protein